MRNIKNNASGLKKKLIVSCQALPEEPLHSSFIMGRMALASDLAGAGGIRANGVEDIKEIKKNTNLPIIGIIKESYEHSDVFITPTIKEVDALYKEGVQIIALDATNRIRPDGTTINELFPYLKKQYPSQLFMADCSNYKEAINAGNLNFDYVSTTLHGYTPSTEDESTPNFNMIEKIVKNSQTPIIAEGNIKTPEQLKKAFDLGVYAAVIGSAITRPLEITKRFLKSM